MGCYKTENACAQGICLDRHLRLHYSPNISLVFKELLWLG